jgi:2-polyprenyl-3-methyl-5-hydroxy-6-metoxy-1,4-benzoquinol methylase
MAKQKELITSKLKSIYQHHDDYQTALVALRQFLGELTHLKVLEAGCGSASHIPMNDCFVTGIDISPYQLERNQRLSERICADLHQYDNPAWQESFDVIICWNVLEHLQNPKVVVEKFFKWLKPSGKMILGYPNPQIWKGVVTKYSPYFVHQLFYRIASARRSVQVKPTKVLFRPSLPKRFSYMRLCHWRFQTAISLHFSPHMNRIKIALSSVISLMLLLMP